MSRSIRVVSRHAVFRDKDIAEQKAAAKAFDDEIAAVKQHELSTDERTLIGEIEQQREVMRPIESKLNAAAVANDEAAARASPPCFATATPD